MSTTRRGKAAPKPVAPLPTATAHGSSAIARRPWREDPRHWIYVAFDVVFTIGFVIAFNGILHNRHGWAQAILYVLPAGTALMAAGTLVGRRLGWWLTIVGGVAMLLWTVAMIVLLLWTAAYLAGVYGAFGKAASDGAKLSVAFVVQCAAFLPALQLKWAMTRAGRRAFGLPPLWPARSPTAPAAARAA